MRHPLASHLRTPRQAEGALTAVETVAVTTMVAALASVSFSEVLPPSREDGAYGRNTVPAGPEATAAAPQVLAHLATVLLAPVRPARGQPRASAVHQGSIRRDPATHQARGCPEAAARRLRCPWMTCDANRIWNIGVVCDLIQMFCRT